MQGESDRQDHRHLYVKCKVNMNYKITVTSRLYALPLSDLQDHRHL